MARSGSRTRARRQPTLSPQDRAYNAGFGGESATDDVLGDPDLLAKFELGKQHATENKPAPKADPAPSDEPSPADPPSTPQTRGGKAAGGGKSGTRRGGGALSKPLPRSVVKASPVPIPGGDAGGLLLAIVLYPVALSILTHGAAGPGIWFRAKFLNRTPTDAAAKQAKADAKAAERPDPRKKSLEKPVPPGFDGTYTGNGGGAPEPM